MPLSKLLLIASWVLQLIVAVILFQTLFFKFTGAEESVYIFRTLGMEPWGRIGSGVAELICVILLLYPRTVPLGAILALGVISGAIFSHLTKLGIVVKDDGGLLFFLAVAVFVGSLAILFIRRQQIPVVGPWFRPAYAAADGGKKKVLILGGGFGGVYTALELEKTLARDADVQITLVNRDNFFLFTPMLHEVAASDLDLTNIVSPIRKLLRRIDFFAGDVESLDLDSRRATLVHGSTRHTHVVEYDYLVIALGCMTNFYNLPGLQERALTMKTLGDAIALRNHVIAHLEEADAECAAAIRGPLVTFVVAGGGFAGVETIGGLNDFVRQALRYYPHIRPDQVRMLLVHAGPAILPELGEQLGRYAQRKLQEEKIEIRVNTRVSAVTGDTVLLSDGTSIDARTIVWTAGTSPHPLLSSLPCVKEAGRIRVNRFLEVESHPGVYALGDCAAIPDGTAGKFHPPTAQHALREGAIVAHNLQAAIRGHGGRPFTFKTLGQLAAIGRRTGVARIMGFNFSGFVAWFLWRTIYLSKLPRFEKKLRVALDWTLDLFFSKDLVQYLTVRGAAMEAEHAEMPAPAMNRSREIAQQPVHAHAGA